MSFLSFDARKQEPTKPAVTQVKLSFQIANDHPCTDMFEEITRSIKGVSIVPQLLW